MRKLTLFFALILFANLTFANDDDTTRWDNNHEIRTLFGKNKKIGGYGGFSFGLTTFNEDIGLMAAGKGGVIIGQHLTLGLAGKGFSTDYQWETNTSTSYTVSSGGYGGFLIEPIIFPRAPIHFSFPVVVGAGGLMSYRNYFDATQNQWTVDNEFGSAFFVVEAGAELELNLTKFFRMDFGASYRYTSKIVATTLSPKYIDGLTFEIGFKFGKF